MLRYRHLPFFNFNAFQQPNFIRSYYPTLFARSLSTQRCQNRGRHFKNASFFCPRQRIIDPANQSQRASWKLRPMKSDGRRGLRTPTRTQWLSTGERVRDDAWCWFKETGLRIGKVCALLPLPPTLENRSLNYCTGENLDLWQHYLERDTP